MFIHMEGLSHDVRLHPVNMKLPKGVPEGKKVSFYKIAAHKAWLELQYSFDPDIGYIVQVQRIRHISEGTLQPQTGQIQHTVTYDAVAQFPIQGEVIHAVVFMICESCIIFQFMGMIYGIVTIEQFPVEEDYEFQETQDTPVQANARKMGTFVSKNDVNKNLVVGVLIRLRIIKRAYGNSGFWLQGSMKNKFLGVRLKESQPEITKVSDADKFGANSADPLDGFDVAMKDLVLGLTPQESA